MSKSDPLQTSSLKLHSMIISFRLVFDLGFLRLKNVTVGKRVGIS